MNRDKSYEIVISDFIKAINTNQDNEELTEELWHCVAQIEKIKIMFNERN